MQQSTAEQQKKSTDPLFTALAVILFLGGFYLAGSTTFLTGASGFVRFGVVIASLIASAAALWPTSHRAHIFSLMRGARIEMRKMRWPTKDDAVKTTMVVLLLVAIFSIVLSIFDWILTSIVKALL
jgi:preprotein translocase, secE subunit